MTADVLPISKRFSARKHSLRNRPALLVLLAFMLIPSIALFCLQWNSQASPGKTVRPAWSGRPILATSSGFAGTSSWFREFLKGSRIAPLSEVILPDSGNAFRNLSNREMISAKGDAFLYAFLMGQSEGVLAFKEDNGGIPTLGIPGINGSYASSTSLDALQLLEDEVGGSFAAFRSKLFGASLNGLNQAGSGAQQADNPFSKALTSALENNDDSPASQDESKHTAENNEEIRNKESTSDSTSGLSGRPYLMLRVDDAGNLHAMPASQPYDGAFETAESGTMEYSILPFGNTADFMGNIAVADFNGDGLDDVAYFSPFQGLLRFFYGSVDGTFNEGLNIDAGSASRSMATGDFNNDGLVDIALSSRGSSLVTVLYGNSQPYYTYRSYHVQKYWDYLAAADTSGTGILDLIGVSYADNAVVLLSFNKDDRSSTGKVISYTPALNSSISTSNGHSVNLNAVLLSSSLSLNVDNRMSQLTNVLNVSPDSNVSIVVGDLVGDGGTVIGIAIPRP